MNCEPCGKCFTGIVSYNQHIESEKHKKKISSLNLFKSKNTEDVNLATNPVGVSKNKTQCPVCDISFDSFEGFQNHSLTLEHVTNVSKSILKNRDNLICDTVSSSSNNDILNDTRKSIFESNDVTDTIIPPVQNYGISQIPSFTECKTCKKYFSGPEPYRQHMESAAHMKKVEMENFFAGTSQNNIKKFECDPCKKVFSGIVPYNQHINSEVHRKKLQSIQLLEKFKEGGMECSRNTECNLSTNIFSTKNDIDGIKDMGSNLAWFCKICLVQCSGPFPYEHHLTGDTHRKNLRKAQLLEDISNPGSNIQYAGNYVGQQNTFNKKENENLENTYPKSFYFEQKMEMDYLIPQMVEKMNVVTFDEMNLKEFLPDEKINFDKIENNEPKPISDKGNLLQQISTENQTSEILDGNFKCDLCNVQLQNKDDILSHYESAEHFNKRWLSN